VIVGNGINSGIILLARFVEERQQDCPHRRPSPALSGDLAGDSGCCGGRIHRPMDRWYSRNSEASTSSVGSVGSAC